MAINEDSNSVDPSDSPDPTLAQDESEQIEFSTVFTAELKNSVSKRRRQYELPEDDFGLPAFENHLIDESLQSDALRNIISEMKEKESDDAWNESSAEYKPGLIGLALSGGGIRSATFNLGIVQVLEAAGLFKCFDYLSTVSGGGYLGTYISTYFSNPDRIKELQDEKKGEEARETTEFEFPFTHRPGEEESNEMRHLRNNSNYMAPDGLTDGLAIPIVLARGIVINLLIILPYMLITALLLSFAIVTKTPGPYSYGSLWDVGFWGGNLDYNFPVTSACLGALTLIMATYPYLQHRQRNSGKDLNDFESKRSSYLRKATGFLVFTVIVAFVELQPLALSFFVSDWSKNWSFSAIPIAVLSNMFSHKLLDRLGSLLGKVVLLLIGLIGFFAVWVTLLYLTVILVDPSKMFNSSFIVGNDFSLPKGYSVAAILVFFYTWWNVDINFTGIHKFYRDKLGNAFVDRYRSQEGMRGVSPNLEDLRPEFSPYHLINTTVNVDRVDGENAFRNGRRASFFVFAKEYCGGIRTGYFPTNRWKEKTGKSLDIATAMAISAAAVSPRMGKYTQGSLTFVLSLLNLRLNYWLSNPRRLAKKPDSKILTEDLAEKWDFEANRAGPRYLLREMIGKLKADNRLINLSDGGHIENLGVYELLRRQCRFIVAGDGEADSGLSFDGLAEVIRMARIDFGYHIIMEGLDDIRAGTQQYAVGKIYYTDERVGHLLYLKLNLGGDYNLQATLSEGQYRTSSERNDDYLFDDSPVIARYRNENSTFPHQSTADQFFDEVQFESYRALGHQVAKAALFK